MPLKGLTPGSFASFPSPKQNSGATAVVSNIKSIQRGNVAFVAAGSTSLPSALASIDITKSIVLFSVITNSSNVNTADVMFEASITNATTLTILRNNNSGGATVYWEVIEFNNVKSMQSGNTASTSVTITAVNTAKSIVICSMVTGNTSTNNYNVQSAYELTNSTTITFFQPVTGTTYWQVIEFN